jgi:hypothetical protein
LLVPAVQGQLDDATPIGKLFYARLLELPIPVGTEQNVQPTPFRAVALRASYSWSVMGVAEQNHRLSLYDADLYMAEADLHVFGDRARRCVVEALAIGDVRNFGMDPAGALAPETFSQASVGVQLMGATGYFANIARLISRL